MSSICALVCGSSTCAKSLTYPVGCNCDTDSALAAMPRNNIHVARHTLTRTFTPKLYRTFPARASLAPQSSCLCQKVSFMEAEWPGHLGNLQGLKPWVIMGENGLKPGQNPTLGSNARRLAGSRGDVEGLCYNCGRRAWYRTEPGWHDFVCRHPAESRRSAGG